MAKYCIKCGTPCDEQSNFCKHCGYNLKESAVQNQQFNVPLKQNFEESQTASCQESVSYEKTRNTKSLVPIIICAAVLIIGIFLIIGNGTGNSSSSGSTSVFSSFSIVGKWKNVGTKRFGQAGVGGVISFTENQVNLISPRDTYALSKNGKQYTIDGTDLLGSSYSYTVTVIDNDNIKIGDVEFTRME